MSLMDSTLHTLEFDTIQNLQATLFLPRIKELVIWTRRVSHRRLGWLIWIKIQIKKHFVWILKNWKKPSFLYSKDH